VDPTTNRLKPYLASFVHASTSDPFDHHSRAGFFCDIEGTDPDWRVPVADRVLKLIIDMALSFEAKIADVDRMHHDSGGAHDEEERTEFSRRAKNLRKSARSTCPVIAAYNGAAFDLFFVMQALLHGSDAGAALDPAHYRIVPVFKGSTLVTFSITSKRHFCTILRAHDLCQITQCSLKRACASYLSQGDPSNRKIDFVHEILDISAHRYREWADWDIERYKIERTIKAPVDSPSIVELTENNPDGRRYRTFVDLTYRPFAVIDYCTRDTEVLPKLYRVIDEMTRTIAGVVVFSFLTIGGIAFYGAMQKGKKLLVNRSGRETHNSRRDIDLFPLDAKQDAFVRKAVYGGRACPRLLHDNVECVYLDVSGMYGSVLERASFPFGAITELPPAEAAVRAEIIVREAKQLIELGIKHSVHPIHLTGFRAPDFWIAEVEFQENLNSLEPILADKSSGSTRYNVERRRAVMTSFDLEMILVMGGGLFGVGRMIHFANNAKWIADWATICREGKMKYKRSNPPLSNFYKVLLNSTFGQMMRKDHTDEFMVVSKPEETLAFMRQHQWRWALMLEGPYDVLYGAAHEDIASFYTTRPTYVGAFVLAFARLMVQQIVQLVNPDNDPALQPRVGDTDSLCVPLSCIDRLRSFRLNAAIKRELGELYRAEFDYIGEGVRGSDGLSKEIDVGWFPAKARAGSLTDELLDTILSRGLGAGGRMPQQQQMAHYSDPDRFAVVERLISPAPKMLAVIFRDPVTGKRFIKFRSKGIAESATLGAVEGMDGEAQRSRRSLGVEGARLPSKN